MTVRLIEHFMTAAAIVFLRHVPQTGRAIAGLLFIKVLVVEGVRGLSGKQRGVERKGGGDVGLAVTGQALVGVEETIRRVGRHVLRIVGDVADAGPVPKGEIDRVGMQSLLYQPSQPEEVKS